MSDRLETGIVQCGEDDWPGVFIRGDRAIYLALILKDILDSYIPEKNWVGKMTIESLTNLLNSCNVKNIKDETVIQYVEKMNETDS